MDTRTLAAKAERLRQLHHGPHLLVLPNAWDVASARILEEMGFPAIATGSAGVAAVLGYPDGQRIPRGEMLDMVARIARAVRVPVTADMESGYGTTAEDAARLAKELIAAGAVGLNYEDVTGDNESSHVELGLQTEKLRKLREASDSLGVPLVINARTDIYLLPIGPESTRFERTVERLRAYREAGADCLFAPGVGDPALIARLVRALQGPLNILVSAPGCPSLPELEKLGVARASFGSSVMRAALGTLRRVAREALDTGTYKCLRDGIVPYDELQRILARPASA